MKLDNYLMRELLNAEDWQAALRLIAEAHGLPQLDYPLNIKFIKEVESDDLGISLYYDGRYYTWMSGYDGFWPPWSIKLQMKPHGICRLPTGWKKDVSSI